MSAGVRQPPAAGRRRGGKGAGSLPGNGPAAFPEGPAGRLAARLGALAGWRRLGLALLLGLCSSLAFAPLWVLPALLPAFAGLVWLLAGVRRGRSAFAVGWAFGVGHFLGGLYWVGIAMTVDFARFWWFLPISVGGLALGLALFIGLAAWLTWASGTRGFSRLLVLATAWMLAEWLRSWVLTGFPWNQLGSVWAFDAWPIQIVSLGGIWGLTILTLLAAAAPALLGEADLGRRRRLAGLAGACGPMAAALIFGLLRLQSAPAAGSETVEGVGLRLVQPSVEQTLKWRADLRAEHVERLIALTRQPAGAIPVTHVIWPETAVPYNLWRDDELRALLGGIVPPDGLLITGAPRYQQGEGSWNSLYAIDTAGSIVAVYDKAHLVPFGEYVPFRSLLGSLDITVTQGSFEAGDGLKTLALPGLPPASPLICYEVIFSGAVTAGDGAPRPAWLLNITNDAWFGRSSGPYQHFAQARLRAVEEGLPLVRSANNGISAVIDPHGRVLGALGQDAVGILDAELPRGLDSSTIYSTLSTFPVVMALLLPALVVAVRSRRQAVR